MQVASRNKWHPYKFYRCSVNADFLLFPPVAHERLNHEATKTIGIGGANVLKKCSEYDFDKVSSFLLHIEDPRDDSVELIYF